MAKFDHIAERDAVREFLDEVNAQCWRFGYKSQASLGAALEVSHVTAGKYLRDPSDMSFATIRRLVKALKPDPILFLKAFGYTTSDIKKLVKELEK